MKTIIELFSQQFMLTKSNADPRELDFPLLTQEKIILNPDRTPASKAYYMNYDEVAEVFSNLAVQCNYTYTYDPQGVLVKRVEAISWYFESGEVGTTRTINQVYATV